MTLPEALADRYTVLGLLGAGASGDVLEAQDRVLGRTVAIKLVPRPGPGAGREAADAYARFVREAQAAGRLAHPHIITVHEFGESASAAWIVMEKAQGSLKARLEQDGRLPPAQAVALVLQVLDALAYSHAAGIVHRDIKPGNILLSAAGDVRIVDFGIARIEDSTLTRQGEVTGTPSYMAPEQVGGEVADARTDLWATGAVLYEALTGTKAFDGAWPVITHRIRNTEPAPASALAVDLPPGLDAVLAKAMAKRPAERFQSAADFAAALRATMAPARDRPRRRWPARAAVALLVAGAAVFLARPPAPPDPQIEAALPCVLAAGGLGDAEPVAPAQCPLLDLLRRLDAPMLAASLADGSRLAEGALLRFDVTLPDWARFLSFDYVQGDGTVVHLDQLGPQSGGTRFRLGERSGDFPGWTIAPPFGTDLLLLVATERQVLPATRPESEALADVLARLEAAHRAGVRLAVRLLRIETTPP